MVLCSFSQRRYRSGVQAAASPALAEHAGEPSLTPPAVRPSTAREALGQLLVHSFFLKAGATATN